ncbi:uncharacterized protein G2W53_007226 [Senna tora]|uniref:Uncharacterized protein n=1 Tax=Senna tora TaxID=362788 RepID=A0A834X6Q6_9FABA|nr:uncharacterized protein G2W53_007226 [Senna tora]
MGMFPQHRTRELFLKISQEEPNPEDMDAI